MLPTLNDLSLNADYRLAELSHLIQEQCLVKELGDNQTKKHVLLEKVADVLISVGMRLKSYALRNGAEDWMQPVQLSGIQH